MSEDSLRPIAFPWTTRLDDFVPALAWSPDGAVLAVASVSGQVALHDAGDGKLLQLHSGAHAEGCDALAWRPDGAALATAGRDGNWKLWPRVGPEPLVTHPAGALWVEHLAWSPTTLGESGPLLAVGAGNRVTLWNPDGTPRETTLSAARSVAGLAWTAGQLAVATSGGVTLYDPLTGQAERTFASRDALLNLAFSPSGKWLMTATQDCGIHIWNTDSGAEMHMRGYAAKVRQLAWHRAGRWLAAGGGEAVSVWDCSGRGPEGRTPGLLEWHTDLLTALHYQPAGDWLASGARDGSVAVWSPTQRRPQISGAKISEGVTTLAWSPDGTRLAVAGERGEVQVLAVE